MKPDVNGVPSESGEIKAELGVRAATSGHRQAFLRLMILVLMVFGVLAILHLTPIGQLTGSVQSLRSFINSFGVRGELTFALLTALMMAIGAPRLIFYGFGGLLFGFWDGLLAALVGSLFGSLVMFRIARWGGRKWVRQRFGEHRLFGRLAHVRPTVMAVVAIRQLPLSNVLINVGLALSRVRGRIFALGTLIGFLPQGIIASLIGGGLAEGLAWQGTLQLILACCLAIGLGIWAVRRRGRRRGFEGTGVLDDECQEDKSDVRQ